MLHLKLANKKITLPHLSELIIIVLYMWYLCFFGFTGFNGNTTLIILHYKDFDKLLYVFMFLLTIIHVLRHSVYRVKKIYIIIALMMVVPSLLSFVMNNSLLSQYAKFSMAIYRPLILISFLYLSKVDIDSLFEKITKISWYLLIYNIPSVIIILSRIKLGFITKGYHDAVVGFFPFINSDAMAYIYTVVLLNNFSKLYISNDYKIITVLRIILPFFLLITTVNMKLISIGFVSIFLLFFRKSLKMVMVASLLSMVSFYFLFEKLWPVYVHYYQGISLIPALKVITLFFNGSFSGCSIYFGAGPGMFASSIGLSSHAPLALKYIQPLKDFYLVLFGGATGSLTNVISSLITLLTETGVVGAFFYFLALVLMFLKIYKYVNYSKVFITAYVFGMILLPMGIFMNTWSWGIEILFFSIAFSSVLLIESGKVNRGMKIG